MYTSRAGPLSRTSRWAARALAFFVILDLEFPHLGLIRLDAFLPGLVDVRDSMKREPSGCCDALGPRGDAVREGSTPSAVRTVTVTRGREAVIRAMREGVADEEQLFYRVRDLLGARHLITGRFRDALVADLREPSRQGLVIVTIEDHEYFMTPTGRAASLSVVYRETTTCTR